jgi:hypothetical protein
LFSDLRLFPIPKEGAAREEQIESDVASAGRLNPLHVERDGGGKLSSVRFVREYDGSSSTIHVWPGAKPGEFGISFDESGH